MVCSGLGLFCDGAMLALLNSAVEGEGKERPPSAHAFWDVGMFCVISLRSLPFEACGSLDFPDIYQLCSSKHYTFDF